MNYLETLVGRLLAWLQKGDSETDQRFQSPRRVAIRVRNDGRRETVPVDDSTDARPLLVVIALAVVTLLAAFLIHRAVKPRLVATPVVMPASVA